MRAFTTKKRRSRRKLTGSLLIITGSQIMVSCKETHVSSPTKNAQEPDAKQPEPVSDSRLVPSGAMREICRRNASDIKVCESGEYSIRDYNAYAAILDAQKLPCRFLYVTGAKGTLLRNQPSKEGRPLTFVLKNSFLEVVNWQKDNSSQDFTEVIYQFGSTDRFGGGNERHPEAYVSRDSVSCVVPKESLIRDGEPTDVSTGSSTDPGGSSLASRANDANTTGSGHHSTQQELNLPQTMRCTVDIPFHWRLNFSKKVPCHTTERDWQDLGRGSWVVIPIRPERENPATYSVLRSKNGLKSCFVKEEVIQFSSCEESQSFAGSPE